MRLLIILILLPLKIFAQDDLSTGLQDPCQEEINRYVTPGAIVLSSAFTEPPASADLSKYLPAVGNQGIQGACTAFSVAAALTILTHQKSGKTFDRSVDDFNFFISPAFIFNIGKSKYPYPRSEDCRDGISFIDAFLVVRDNGAVYWPLSQYNSLGNGGCLNEHYPTVKALKAAQANKILTFQKPDLDLNLFKCLLSQKPGYPVCIGVHVDTEYQKASNKENSSTWSKKGSAIPGLANDRHAMLVVGYDDTRRSFKVLDSRGSGKGERGFIWLSYDLLEKRVIYDAYVCSFDESLLKSQKSQGLEETLLLGSTKSTFLKKNYYRAFNGIKITCVDLDTENENVKFRINNSYSNNLITDVTLGLNQQKQFIINGKAISLYTKEFSRSDGRNPFKKSIRFDVSIEDGALAEEVIEEGLFRETLTKLYLWTHLSQTKTSIKTFSYVGGSNNTSSVSGNIIDLKYSTLFRFPDSVRASKGYMFYSNPPFTTTQSGETTFEIFSLRNFIKVMANKGYTIDNGYAGAYDTLVEGLITSQEKFHINSWTWSSQGVKLDQVINYYATSQDPTATSLRMFSETPNTFLVVHSEDLVGFEGKLKLPVGMNSEIRKRLRQGLEIHFNQGKSMIKISPSALEDVINIVWKGELTVFAYLTLSVPQ